MKTITIERSHFIENTIESEFHWILYQLGITDENQQKKINEIEITYHDFEIVDKEN